VTGSSGINNIVGSAGNDTIDGAGGNDIITGGAGNDIMVGGAGVDTFVLGATALLTGVDTIADFVSGTDKLDLNAFESVGTLVDAATTFTTTAGTVIYSQVQRLVLQTQRQPPLQPLTLLPPTHLRLLQRGLLLVMIIQQLFTSGLTQLAQQKWLLVS